jgi:hypothetical protein
VQKEPPTWDLNPGASTNLDRMTTPLYRGLYNKCGPVRIEGPKRKNQKKEEKSIKKKKRKNRKKEEIKKKKNRKSKNDVHSH